MVDTGKNPREFVEAKKLIPFRNYEPTPSRATRAFDCNLDAMAGLGAGAHG